MRLFDRFRKKPDAPAAPASPAAPAPRVVELPAEELKARIDRGDAPLIVDVREPWEHNIAQLPGATLMPMNTIPARMSELDRDAEIVVYCHHGMRSWNVAAYLAQNGFVNVKNLTGGIDTWARRIEPGMRKY
ncbi:MAG: rhodanese [Chloroflexi bacterium]|nr:rhodanese [Chloroflexota bacterium]